MSAEVVNAIVSGVCAFGVGMCFWKFNHNFRDGRTRPEPRRSAQEIRPEPTPPSPPKVYKAAELKADEYIIKLVATKNKTRKEAKTNKYSWISRH